jgi:hypothetical protein
MEVLVPTLYVLQVNIMRLHMLEVVVANTAQRVVLAAPMI